jgi:ubiquinone/menaquinone biosynthesis C-methylase UbiE
MIASQPWRGSIRTTTKSQSLEAVIPQSEIGPLYDKISRFYDFWGKLTESRAAKRAVELADIQDGQYILEVAVGTGLVFQEIVRRNPNGQNTGVDLSEGMLAKARRRLSKTMSASVTLTQGTAVALQIESSCVDLLVNNYMFDLISFQEMDEVLAEFHRVLKPGGRLVLVNMTVGRTFGNRMYDRFYSRFPRLFGGCRGVELTEILVRNRFEVRVREYIQQCLFPSEVIVARKID